MDDHMIRQWSQRVYAVYVPDGVFGRRVGLANSREEAEILAAQALRASACLDSNAGTMGAGEGSALTLDPHPDRPTFARKGGGCV